jgi:hypothetical protein
MIEMVDPLGEHEVRAPDVAEVREIAHPASVMAAPLFFGDHAGKGCRRKALAGGHHCP